MSKKIVLTGGGTAGHVTPNLALLPYLKQEGYEVIYIGSQNGIERTLIEAEGIPYYGISTGVCKIVYHRCCTDRFYGKGTSDLLSCIVCVRYTDRLPDDLCVHRKCTVFHYRGNPAEIHIADSIDLHITACYGK